MLLARQGLRVLAVDRVSFPSDTISSQQLQVPGAALLHRWGLLGKLAAAGTPPARRVRFDAGGGLVVDGQFPAYEGVDANALRDASSLSAAVAAGLAGALHDHQRRRDRAIRGMYDFTLGLAASPQAVPGQRLFLAAVAADQQETGRFLGALAGIVPPERYFTPATALRVLGTRGIRKLTTAGVLSSARMVPRPRVPGRLPGGDRYGR